MPRINLLPWREERRKEQQKVFGITAGAVAAFGALVVYLAMVVVDGNISHQEARNAMLQDQIRLLDRRIAEIRQLEATKASLLARMQIIEELQSSRPEIVHLFDELVRTLPDGVHLTSVRQSGARLEIRGIAQSSARVSAYMRAIEASEYLTIGNLEIIQTVTGRGAAAVDDRSRQFILHATQVSPRAAEDSE